VKKNQKGNIDVAITPLEKTSDLILKLNGSKELKLTEKIDTKKRVLDGAQYLFNRFKMSIILLTTIAVSVTAIFFLGWLNYRSKVQNYKVVKDLYYRVNGKIRTLSIELSVKNCPTIFINLGEDSIYESVKEERAIGCFELRWPKGTKAVTGLLYIFKGKSIFEVSYDAIIDQTIFLDEMEENTPVSYRDDLLIRFKHRSINYEIQFQ
ncbi:MAG: hypothetical protein Q8930_07460, partial [Bacillota bacterium]|nr:hypothetical protein [Bacillota bacterium]